MIIASSPRDGDDLGSRTSRRPIQAKSRHLRLENTEKHFKAASNEALEASRVLGVSAVFGHSRELLTVPLKCL